MIQTTAPRPDRKWGMRRATPLKDWWLIASPLQILPFNGTKRQAMRKFHQVRFQEDDKYAVDIATRREAQQAKKRQRDDRSR